MRKLLLVLLLCSVSGVCEAQRVASCWWPISNGPVGPPGSQCFKLKVTYRSGFTELFGCGDSLPVGCNADPAVDVVLGSVTGPFTGTNYTMRLDRPACATGPYIFGYVSAPFSSGPGAGLSWIGHQAGGVFFSTFFPNCSGTCPTCSPGGTGGGGQQGPPCVGGLCAPDKQCVNGICVTPCFGDGECVNGQTCQDGICGDPCPGGCPAGQHCQNGQCVADCDPPCPPGQKCIDGVCDETPGCKPGGIKCADPNGDCDGDGIRNGCDPDCRPECERSEDGKCCVDCGGTCHPHCPDPACSVENNYGCIDALGDGCCDSCGECNPESPRWPSCCKEDPSNPLYPDCGDSTHCGCDQNNYPDCCLSDPENPLYPDCAPCEGCKGCDPCKRLDTIIGLLRDGFQTGNGGSIPGESTPTRTPALVATKPTISWNNLQSSDIGGSMPSSSAWTFYLPVPGRGNVPITFGSKATQWTVDGHPINADISGAIEVLRLLVRSVLALIVLWKFGYSVVKLLYTF